MCWGLLDAYSRGLQHAGRTRDILRDGAEPTMTAVESGVPTPEPMRASLHRIDVAAVRAEEVDTFPTYPLDGVLQIALFPDGRSAALLTTVGAIRPGDTRRYASPYASWAVDKSLGFVELAPGSPIRWLEEMPEAGRYILDLQPRRSDGSAVAIRARPAVTTRAQSLFTVSALDLSVTRFSPEEVSVAVAATEADVGANFTVMWTPDGSLLAGGVREAELPPVQRYEPAQDRSRTVPRADWWLFSGDAAPVNLTATMESVPSRLRPAPGDRYVGVADEAL